MKTLLVHYLPRGNRSHTKKLLEAFRSHLTEDVVEELDLLEDQPDMFLGENLNS